VATLLTNAYLSRPSVLWCWDLYWESSFPITFPWTFDVAPLHVSTTDLYMVGPPDVLYEERLLEKPTVTFQSTDSFGGLEEIDQVRFRLLATAMGRWKVPLPVGGGFDPTGFDPAGFDVAAGTAIGTLLTPLGPYSDLHAWVAAEHRGKLCIGHLVTLNTQGTVTAVTSNVFRGELLALADDPATVSVVARAFDLSTYTELVPEAMVTTAWAPYAPSTSFGRVVPFGIGIGRRIPCVPVKAIAEIDSSYTATFTASFSADTLTILDHGLNTGDGPFILSSTGTLPGGLALGTDYWVIIVDADTLRLATHLGYALVNTFVDITDAGTGTHTLTGGLPASLSEDYDLVVGTGNVGIVRIWEDEAAQGSTADSVPDVPVTYQILHRTYRPTGRYLTAVRFQDQLDGVSVTADVLRVYPDVDDNVVAEWKWLTGFRDDVGAFTAVAAPDASEIATTGDLVPTHQGYGLGGVLLNGNKWLDAQGSGRAMALETFTLELEAIPALTSASLQASLVAAPRWPDSVNHPWHLFYDEDLQRLLVQVFFQDGSNWTTNTPTGSVPRGRPFRAVLRRDGAAGKTELFIGRVVSITDTRASPLKFAGGIDKPLRLGGPFGFRGTLGYVRYSRVPRTQREIDAAFYLWRRNPIEFCRELLADAGRLLDGSSFDVAAAMLDSIEAGTLRCDGWLIEPNELRAALTALIAFRDLAFSIGANQLLAVDVPQPLAALQGQFGHGDDYANLLELPTRVRASLTEVVGRLVLHFRRPRNQTGPFGGYAMELVRPVTGIGKDVVLELPFVDQAPAADLIGSFRANRMRTRDQLITTKLGHEGRFVTKGGGLRLNVPTMGITAVDLEALQVVKGAEQVTVLGVPTNDQDFLYTPSQRLPIDPVDRTLQLTDLGNAQSLSAVLANGRLTLKIILADGQILRPIRAGLLQWPTLVGAPTPWEAVDDITPDDATSYVEDAVGQRFELFTYPQITPLPHIDSLTVKARLRAVSMSIPVPIVATLQPQAYPRPMLTSLPTIWSVTTAGTWQDFSFDFPQYTFGDPRPWTIEDVNGGGGISAGVYINGLFPSGGGSVQMTQVQLWVNQRRDVLPTGYVLYWIRGPSVSAPPAPAESDVPSFPAALDLAPQVTDLTGTSGDTYWIWAGIYDEFGRRISLIGPTSVVIP